MKLPFSLDELMMFHEIVSTGSLTRASNNLAIPKSTLSRRIAALEGQLGTILLKRTTRKMLPTEVGQDLFERCERLIDDLADVNKLLEESRSEVSGSLRVSIPNEFGSGWLGSAIAAFSEKYPLLQLAIDVSPRPVDIMEHSYDVAIAYGRLPNSQLASRRLISVSHGLYGSPKYLADRNGVLDAPEQLKDHKLIVTEVQVREEALLFRRANARRRLSLPAHIVVNSSRLARDLVLAGAGLAMLPKFMCAGHVAAGRLQMVLPAWQCPSVDVYAIVLARVGIPKKTRIFLEFIAQWLRQTEGRDRL